MVTGDAFGAGRDLASLTLALDPVLCGLLVPHQEMSYENMAVANGRDAGLAWESLVRGGLEEASA